MTSVESTLTRRHASLADLADLLKQQHASKLDMVVPAGAMRAVGGCLQIDGTGEAVLSPDGVTTGPGRFVPTGTCDAGVAEKLGIPVAYLRRTRQEHVELYDVNVNTWLADEPGRRFLVRALRDGVDPGRAGIARALLSEKYRFVDNLDVLLAVLAGVRESGAAAQVTSCDLSERRMYVQIRSDDIAAYAPALLANYVSPFTGAAGADNPVVFAGFVVSNSETGHGSTSITPQLIVQVCDNGMTITRDAMREVHLGGRLADGVVQWSAATQQAALALITRQAADAVSTFLDRGYVERTIAGIETEAGVRVGDVPATVKHVGSQLRFSEEQQATILDHFIDGRDRTAGGVLHAVTSAAQTQTDADTAYEMERAGLRAMSLAAAFQR
jgi:hypothetical protein